MAQAAHSVAQSLRGAWGASQAAAPQGRAPGPPSGGAPSAPGRTSPPQQPSYAAPTQSDHDDPPFPPEQAGWLRAALSDAVGSSLERFGAHLDVQLNGIRQELAAVRFEAAEAASVATGTRQATQDQERRLAELTERFDELERLTRLSASPATASEHSSVPYEQWQLAILGCLGWDTPPEELLHNATEALQRAGVPQASYSHIAPLVPAQGRGSGAEIFFLSPQALQQARVAIRSARVSYVPGKYVWLDAKKERSETAPARMIHRLHEAVAEAMLARAAVRGQQVPRVDKDVRGRSLRADGHRAAYVAQLRVRWTAAGVAAFSAQEREDAAAFAEAL